MKRLIVLILPLLVSCATYDTAMVTGFDGGEYQIVTEIGLDAQRYQKQCGTPTAAANADSLTYKSELFVRYSQGIPHNDDMIQASKSLNEIVQGLNDRYKDPTPVPKLFCELKYTSIENAAGIIQHVIGNRPR